MAVGSFVTLKIYDVLGIEVATLVNGVKEPGTYETEFDAKNLSSGIYFYRLSAEVDDGREKYFAIKKVGVVK